MADALARDLRPNVDRIEELAQRIKDGDIRLPKFQRDFVWEKHQIIDLLDSIAKNYPIGSVLLWLSTQKLASERNIAELKIKEKDEIYPVNYLLDGQQRLSTICGALFWDGQEANSVWNLVYDLRNQKFYHLDHLGDPPLHQIRMNKLSDSAKFFKHVFSLDNLDASDKESLKQAADKLFNRFKDYRIATVTLADMSIDAVAPIFERINSTGTQLTIVDLMRAATWSPEFDLIDTIDQKILEQVQPKGFGNIERKSVLRNLSAAAGGGFSADSIDHLRNKSAAELLTATNHTVDAYKRAVDYLSTNIGLPNDSSVPYANQIVILAELYRRLPHPPFSKQSAVTRWFWRTACSGYFGGWNTGQMGSDLQAIAEFAEDRTTEIEISMIKPTSEIWKVRQFRANSALSKVLGMLLAFNKPLDMRTGNKIDVGKSLSWSNSKEYHHVFPRAYLSGKGFDWHKINCLSNFALITSATNKFISDKVPSDYLKIIEDETGDSFGLIMDSNFIDENCIDALKQNSYDDFIEVRSQLIHAKVMSYCGWS